MERRRRSRSSRRSSVSLGEKLGLTSGKRSRRRRRNRARRSEIDFSTISAKKIAVQLPWVAACAALAFVAIGLELDRQSRTSPGLAARVPPMFRGFAAGNLAVGRFQSGDLEGGMKQARALVAAMPLPAENLSLLARAELATGHEDKAIAILTAAASRGWRDSLVQTVMAQTALEYGEPAIAADRAAALIAVGEGDEGFDGEFLTRMLSDREVRRAFGQRLASLPQVPERFVNVAPQFLAPTLYADTVAQMWQAGARVDCGTLARSARAFIAAGDRSAAVRLWAGTCGAHESGALNRLAFDAEGGAATPGPFSWEYIDHPDVERTIDTVDGRVVIDYRSRTSATIPLAVRFTGLPIGRHVVAASPSFRGTGAIVRIQCIGPTRAQRPFYRFALGREGASFDVGPDCPVQRIEVAVVASGEGTGLSLTGG